MTAKDNIAAMESDPHFDLAVCWCEFGYSSHQGPYAGLKPSGVAIDDAVRFDLALHRGINMETALPTGRLVHQFLDQSPQRKPFSGLKGVVLVQT